MKQKALYHLLMARIFSLGETIGKADNPLFDSLRETLRIEFTSGNFVLHWRHGAQDFEMEIPGNAISFYLRGDVESLPPPADQRWKNWAKAESLLRKIGDISGAPLSDGNGVKAREAAPRALWNRSKKILFPAVWAVVFGLVALAGRTWAVGIWTATTALFLLLLAGFHGRSLLGEPLGRPEWIAVAAGCLVPALLGAAPVFAALVALTLLVLCYLESRGLHANPMEWAAGGVVSALPALWSGMAALSVPVLAAVFVLVIHLFVPARITGRNAATFVAAAALGAVLAIQSTLIATSLPSDPETLHLVGVWILVGLAGLLTGTWWIMGQQFLLFPWLGFAILCVTGILISILGHNSDDLISYFSFSGLLLVSVVRVVGAMLRARASRILA